MPGDHANRVDHVIGRLQIVAPQPRAGRRGSSGGARGGGLVRRGSSGQARSARGSSRRGVMTGALSGAPGETPGAAMRAISRLAHVIDRYRAPRLGAGRASVDSPRTAAPGRDARLSTTRARPPRRDVHVSTTWARPAPARCATVDNRAQRRRDAHRVDQVTGQSLDRHGLHDHHRWARHHRTWDRPGLHDHRRWGRHHRRWGRHHRRWGSSPESLGGGWTGPPRIRGTASPTVEREAGHVGSGAAASARA